MNFKKTIYKPYTYKVHFLVNDTFYYGVQYGKDANPENLWNNYFTSSNTIKVLIKVFGKESFDVSVRKTFNNKTDALKWESKVLRKIVTWKNCLNDLSSSSNIKNVAFEKGTKIRITDGVTNLMLNVDEIIPEGWYKGFTTNPEKPSGRQKGHKTYHNNIIEIVVKNGDLVPEGFVRGRLNAPNKGLVNFNNGVKGIRINPNITDIPEGFVKGGLKRPTYKKQSMKT